MGSRVLKLGVLCTSIGRGSIGLHRMSGICWNWSVAGLFLEGAWLLIQANALALLYIYLNYIINYIIIIYLIIL